MYLGENIQYLRKVNRMTQEELAEKLSVSRQTVSKWEMNQAFPEISKIIELSDLFHCRIDELMKTDLKEKLDVYSKVTITSVPSFRMGRYVMISPNPEEDVYAYLSSWSDRSGLMAVTDGNVQKIGWDFPFVSAEQQNRFGLRGYAAACILPDDFEPLCSGVEISVQESAKYACITIRNPFDRAFEYIPEGYKKIMSYMNSNGFREKFSESVLPCFEYIYEKDGVTYMTVCVAVDSLGYTNVNTPLR